MFDKNWFYRKDRTKVAIDLNAYGLAKWGDYTHKSRLELLMFNKSTNAQ